MALRIMAQYICDSSPARKPRWDNMLRDTTKESDALHAIAYKDLTADQMRKYAQEAIQSPVYVDGKKMGQMFMSYVNSASFEDEEKFAIEVTGDHRTLQQKAFRHFVASIKRWAIAARAGMFDLRNEDTAKASRAIVEKVGDGLTARYI